MYFKLRLSKKRSDAEETEEKVLGCSSSCANRFKKVILYKFQSTSSLEGGQVVLDLFPGATEALYFIFFMLIIQHVSVSVGQ